MQPMAFICVASKGNVKTLKPDILFRLLSGKPPRRERTKLPRQTIQELERVFAMTYYPDRKRRRQLARDLNLLDDVVAVWFKNRRAKQKKTHHRH